MALKALYFRQHNGTVSEAFYQAVGDLPGLELNEVRDWEAMGTEALVELIGAYDILLASRAPAIPDELAERPGRLKYICYLHGTMRKVIRLPIIRSDIQVTNWGDRSARGLAEGSLTLLLAVLKDLPRRILAVRRGKGTGIRSVGGGLADTRVGVYGCGYGGREFVRLLAPFGSPIRIYDPYLEEILEGCRRVTTLRDLFTDSHAVVIHAGLTEETKGSVTRELLALLPDQGIIINTARGAILDQEALFDELRSGRLRAGVDVLWPDELPPDHEARQWPNLIWTCHHFGGAPWPDTPSPNPELRYRPFLENIRAFVDGLPLKFLVDEERYSRMT